MTDRSPRQAARVSLFGLAVAAMTLVSDVTARAQDPLWGQKMFEVTELKFGSVAKGAEALLQVKVKNVYREDIHITNLATGCGCVKWVETTRSDPPPEQYPLVIPSGQQRFITLQLDTVRYEGERKSKAMVTLLDPVHGAATVVEFPVTAYIRRDIVVTPGAVAFGTLDAGQGGARKVEIHYAGRGDWKLLNARGSNPNLIVGLQETSRGNGLVNYEVVVTLKPETPVGVVRDQIIMETDDVNNPRVSLLVEGRVEADIAITELQFGSLTPGQSKTMNVVVRGRKPFKVEELYREKHETSKLPDEAFKVKLTKATALFHTLPVTFIAPDVPGAFDEEFFVKIEDRPQPIPFRVRGRVIEQTGAAKN